MSALVLIVALSCGVANACPPTVTIKGNASDLRTAAVDLDIDRAMAEPYASGVMNAFDQLLSNVLVRLYSVPCGAPFGPCFYTSPLNAAMSVADLIAWGPNRIRHP